MGHRVITVKLTKEQKDRIVKHYLDGRKVDEIKQLEQIQDGRQITGVISIYRQSLSTEELARIDQSLGRSNVTIPPSPPDAPTAPASTQEADARARLQPEGTPGSTPAGAVTLPPGSVVRSSATLTPQGPAAPTTPSAGPAVGFRPVGTEERILVYREEPPHGYVGRIRPPFDIEKLAKEFKDGRYRIERWLPGRSVPIVMDETITGQGQPSWPRNFEDPYMTPSNAPVASNNGDALKAVVEAVKTGADLASKKEETSSSKPTDKLVEKMLEKAVDNMTQPPKPPDPVPAPRAFTLEEYIRIREIERKEEQARRDEERKQREADDARRRADEEAAHRRRMEEQEAKHKQELELERQRAANALKLEQERADAQRKLEQEYATKQQELFNEKLGLAIKESKESRAQLTEALRENQEKLNQKMAELAKQFDEKRQHDDEILKLKYDQLNQQTNFQMEIVKLEKQKSPVSENELFKLGEKLIDNLSARAKEAIEAQKAAKGLEMVEKNPNLLKDPKVLQAAMNSGRQQQQGNNGESGRQEDNVSKFDQVVSTPEFKEFIEEWATYLEDKTPYQLLFDTLARKIKKEDPTACEFADFIAPRRYAKILQILTPHLTDAQKALFKTEEAEDFYESIRAGLNLLRTDSVNVWANWEIARREGELKKAEEASAAPAEKPSKDAPKEEPKKEATPTA